MSEKRLSLIENSFQSFSPIELLIDVTNSIVTIKPFYWNYRFVSSLIIIPILIFPFTQDVSSFLTIVFIGLILGFLYLIWEDLRYFNTVLVDFHNKTISVIPNKVTGILKKRVVISFEQIDMIKYSSIDFRKDTRKYSINIYLTNFKKLALISTREESDAVQLIKILKLLI